MLNKLLNALWVIHNRNYIPPLPRGYYANPYDEDDITPHQWRVLARIGARDGIGVQYALNKYKVHTVDELIQHLNHHSPTHQFKKRLRNALGRLVGGYDYDPHAKETKRAMKQYFENFEYIVVNERMQKAQSYDE